MFHSISFIKEEFFTATKEFWNYSPQEHLPYIIIDGKFDLWAIPITNKTEYYHKKASFYEKKGRQNNRGSGSSGMKFYFFFLNDQEYVALFDGAFIITKEWLKSPFLSRNGEELKIEDKDLVFLEKSLKTRIILDRQKKYRLNIDIEKLRAFLFN